MSFITEQLLSFHEILIPLSIHLYNVLLSIWLFLTNSDLVAWPTLYMWYCNVNLLYFQVRIVEQNQQSHVSSVDEFKFVTTHGCSKVRHSCKKVLRQMKRKIEESSFFMVKIWSSLSYPLYSFFILHTFCKIHMNFLTCRFSRDQKMVQWKSIRYIERLILQASSH